MINIVVWIACVVALFVVRYCVLMLVNTRIFLSELVKYRMAKSIICQFVLKPGADKDIPGALAAATNEFLFQCEKVLGEELTRESSARYMISSFLELGVNPWSISGGLFEEED